MVTKIEELKKKFPYRTPVLPIVGHNIGQVGYVLKVQEETGWIEVGFLSFGGAFISDSDNPGMYNCVVGIYHPKDLRLKAI